jgi:stage II sporulation protein P
MRDKKAKRVAMLRKTTLGFLLITVVACGFYLYRTDGLIGQLLLYETIPYLNPDHETQKMFKFVSDQASSAPLPAEMLSVETTSGSEHKIYTEGIEISGDALAIGEQIEDMQAVYDQAEIIGTADVVYQDDTRQIEGEQRFQPENITVENIEKLRDLNYLRNHLYIPDGTDVSADLFDVDRFLAADLSLKQVESEPSVLIFHTHASETFVDSDPNIVDDGIIGLGRRMKKELEETYGLNVLHITEKFDVLNGKAMRPGAYERMEPIIEQILADNPSIDLVIDLHRDAAVAGRKFVTEINGKQTAQIMFFNGLSRIFNEEGVLEDVAELPNPNLPTNLALSFNMQMAANQLYPGFAKKIYLKPHRYSLHMRPKSIFIEVGNDLNTKEEIFNTAEPMAEIIANVVLKDG